MRNFIAQPSAMGLFGRQRINIANVLQIRIEAAEL
jgi:hypothetical protein